jgi:tetratricopeptide (TPR) repeat protein
MAGPTTNLPETPLTATPLRQFYTKLNRAKEQLAKGNLHACLANLAEAINLKLHESFGKRDLAAMEEDLGNFSYKLSNHKLYRQTFGPVAMVAGQEAVWLGFLDQLIAAEEEGPLVRLGVGQRHLNVGRLDDARQTFDELLRDFPDDAGLALDIGDRYMDKGLWEDAEEAYRLAMAINPDTLHILNRLAMSLRQEGKLDAALEIYKQALRLNSEDEGLYYNMARVVYQMGRSDLAVKLLKTALAKNPGFEAGQKFLKLIESRTAQEPAA